MKNLLTVKRSPVEPVSQRLRRHVMMPTLTAVKEKSVRKELAFKLKNTFDLRLFNKYRYIL